MKRFMLIAGICLSAQSGLAAEGDRPQPRPALCRVGPEAQPAPCRMLWRVALEADAPVDRPVKARKIVRLPWTIGAFQ